MVIPAVVEQHAEELAGLWTTRERLRVAADVGLTQLARFDERILAHQDACVVAGTEGIRILNAQLETVTAGHVFASGVVGLESMSRDAITRCMSLIEVVPDARRGMSSAMGWVSSGRLRVIGKEMLDSTSAIVRAVGLTACRLHAVDPGAPLVNGFADASTVLRAEAFRAAGVLGRTDLVSSVAAIIDDNPACQFWSAWSAVLLGDRGRGLNTLREIASVPGDNRRRAFVLSCQAMSVGTAHEFLTDLADNPIGKRWVIEGAGLAGDPRYIPWLVTLMGDNQVARLAGEAFTLIAGADLPALDLERMRPEGFEAGPTDNPEDSDVAMDPDEGLPWPDQTKVHEWWTANRSRFQPGLRYFLGEKVDREHCLNVLKNGGQRQRILAAQYLCLLEPQTGVFNTNAPAWRQHRWLAQIASR